MAVPENSIYQYNLSHVLPIVFSILVGISLSIHVYQNFYFRFWKVTFFMFWGGAVFMTGWILRAISSYHPSNLDLYVAQTVFIFAGPPIYSAAEYNVLGRLMHYVPMHAPLNPSRLVYVFIYLGVAVESLTSSGASQLATAKGDEHQRRVGVTLINAALLLQAVIECMFISVVGLMHYRCARSNMLSSNIRTLCIMLYGTSTLVLLRCICRAIEAFSTENATGPDNCNSVCRTVLFHEWYLYAFEAAPMVIYSYWINIIHPGRLLPQNPHQYLDFDGKTERMGPGWTDRRSKWETFLDVFDIKGILKGQPSHDKYWLRPDEWSVIEGRALAQISSWDVLGVSKRPSEKDDSSVNPKNQVTVTHA